MTDTWWEYVQNVSHKARPADIADKTKISAPTISRWNPDNKGGPARPDPDNVVRLARAYERSPLEALICAGYIEADDIGRPVEIPGSMKDVSDASFMAELTNRLAELRRLQLGRDDTEGWPPPGWRDEKSGVGDV